jgi:hypothetical protein
MADVWAKKRGDPKVCSACLRPTQSLVRYLVTGRYAALPKCSVRSTGARRAKPGYSLSLPPLCGGGREARKPIKSRRPAQAELAVLAFGQKEAPRPGGTGGGACGVVITGDRWGTVGAGSHRQRTTRKKVHRRRQISPYFSKNLWITFKPLKKRAFFPTENSAPNCPPTGTSRPQGRKRST